MRERERKAEGGRERQRARHTALRARASRQPPPLLPSSCLLRHSASRERLTSQRTTVAMMSHIRTHAYTNTHTHTPHTRAHTHALSATARAENTRTDAGVLLRGGGGEGERVAILFPCRPRERAGGAETTDELKQQQQQHDGTEQNDRSSDPIRPSYLGRAHGRLHNTLRVRARARERHFASSPLSRVLPSALGSVPLWIPRAAFARANGAARRGGAPLALAPQRRGDYGTYIHARTSAPSPSRAAHTHAHAYRRSDTSGGLGGRKGERQCSAISRKQKRAGGRADSPLITVGYILQTIRARIRMHPYARTYVCVYTH